MIDLIWDVNSFIVLAGMVRGGIIYQNLDIRRYHKYPGIQYIFFRKKFQDQSKEIFPKIQEIVVSDDMLTEANSFLALGSDIQAYLSLGKDRIINPK